MPGQQVLFLPPFRWIVGTFALHGGVAALAMLALQFRMRLLHLVVAGGAVLGVAAAQICPRPTPPPGGFATAADLQILVSYSDSYQTMASLLRPDGTPPPCGWPLVVFVHPLGQNRAVDLPLQMELAGQGYAVWSYDVRAQGQAPALNPAHPNGATTLWGPVERQDLAEQIQFVANQAAYAGVIDANRVAVVGRSQGGAHAWAAAAWSGQPLPALPGRPAMTFPTIACVAATEVVPSATADWLRGGHLFSAWFLSVIESGFTAVAIDPSLVQLARSAFLAQDTSILAPRLGVDERDMVARLSASPVPILYCHAYLDLVSPPLPGIGAFESRSAPSRGLIGTIGHGSAYSAAEARLRELLTTRWLHRWLWNIPNGVESEQALLLAEIPLAAAERDDPTFLWSHAHAASVAPAPTAPRHFLYADHTLATPPPPAPQADAIVHQTIDPTATTFTPAGYLDQPTVRDLANVLAVCPLQQHVYALTTTAETQLARSAVVNLRLVPSHAAWSLSAALTVEPPGSGASEVFLAQGACASRASTAGVAETHQFRLSPVAARIPAGTVVRLRLRNLCLRGEPMQAGLDAAPIFGEFQVAIVHDATNGSWLDLPLEPVAPRLVVSPQAIELATPVPITANLRGGAERAGQPFFGTVGLSGHQPGVPYLNAVMPLALDWLVETSAGSSQPPLFSGFLGWLDQDGRTDFTFDLASAAPLPQVLNGWQLTFAAFVWDSPAAAAGAVTNPADVLLR
jgi:predicted acyl esterase